MDNGLELVSNLFAQQEIDTYFGTDEYKVVFAYERLYVDYIVTVSANGGIYFLNVFDTGRERIVSLLKFVRLDEL